MRRLLAPLLAVLLSACGAADGPRANTAPLVSASARALRVSYGASLTAPQVGDVLSASTGTWQGQPTLFAYQWEDCDDTGGSCADIPGATASTYVIAAGDEGHTLRVRVRATNGHGTSTAESAPTGLVPSSPAPPVSSSSTTTTTATTTATTTTTATSSATSTTSTTPAPAPPAPVVSPCDLYAAPNGSGTNVGTQVAPKDLASLVNALMPGQTGCLLDGTYGAAVDDTGRTPNSGTNWTFTKSGTSAGPITVTAAPGDTSTPTIRGFIELGDGHNDGNYLTFSHLNLDDSNTYGDGCQSQTPSVLGTQPNTAPSDCYFDSDFPCPNATLTARYFPEPLVLNGDGDVLDHDNVYFSMSHRSVLAGIGFQEGTLTGHLATNDVVRYSELHDSGGCGTQHDHALYVDFAQNLQMYDNWVWTSVDGQALVLYQESVGGHFYDNVIDSSGTPFDVAGGGGAQVSSNNQIDHNVATNVQPFLFDDGATSAGTVLACYQAGTGNTVDSTMWNVSPGGFGSCGNITPTNTLHADPAYADAVNHDYTVGNPALSGWGLPTASQMGPRGT